MIRFARLALVLSVVGAAAPAAAFTHETTTRGHPESGLWLWWNTRQVTFRLNAAGAAATGCAGAAAADAVAAGFETWTTATRAGEASSCTDFSFAPGTAATTREVRKDGINLVVFRNGLCRDVITSPTQCNLNVPGDCAAKLNCWEYDPTTLGLTTTWFDATTGEITEADMELFAWGGSGAAGAYFTCQPATTTSACSKPPRAGEQNCQGTDLQAVVTHEAGHVLGLDHVCTTEFASAPSFNACPAGEPANASVMTPNVGDVAHRTLSPDDVSGACTIYPKGGPPLKSPNAGGSTKGGGCSTGGGAGVGAVLAAAFAAWRGRRRSR